MSTPNFATSTENNSLKNLQQQLQQDNLSDQQRKIPPLEKWHPNVCGKMNLQIKANGEWWHEGTKVTRQSLIDLFAKVLWAEVDEQNQVTYFLKTPVEKLEIEVEDAPLLVTQVDSIEQNDQTCLQFTTSQGDTFILDEQHPIRFGLPFSNYNHPQQPYILARQNGDSVLYALLHRNVFFHLIEMGELREEQQTTILRLASNGQFFELQMAHDAIDG